MDTLPGVLHALFGWCLRASAEGAVVVAVILGSRALLRRRVPGSWAYALWLVLLLRLVLPWTPESAVSVFNLLPSPDSVAMELPEMVVLQAPPPVPTRAAPTEILAQPATAPMPPAAPQAIPDSTVLLTGMDLLALLWLAGAVVALAWPIANAYRFRRLALQSQVVHHAGVGELLEDCKALMGITAPVEIRASDAVTTPSILGFLRPRLLIPPALGNTLNREELRFIFLHELAHLKRGDIFINWLLTIVQALHWFNPVIWYAFARMRAGREMACDALALSRLSEDEASAYGQTLLRLFETLTAPKGIPSVAGISEGRSLLKRRIMMIATFRKRSAWWTAAGLALMVVACTTLLTTAKQDRGVPVVTTTTDASGRYVDTTEYPFVLDPEAEGNWASVDFVNEPELFQPGQRQFPGDLYLKGLALYPDGKTDGSWTWTKGLLLDPIDLTASHYYVKEIEGYDYLFLEWKSGDYTIRHMKPKFYVLKRTSAPVGEPAEENREMLTPPATGTRDDFSQKVDAFAVMGSATPEDARRVFGPPLLYTSGGQSYDPANLPKHYRMEYPDGFSIAVQNGRALQLVFNEESSYRFEGRLGMGSSLEETLEVLGPPRTTLEGQPNHAVKDVFYKNVNGIPGYHSYTSSAKGVSVMLKEDKVIGMFLIGRSTPAGANSAPQPLQQTIQTQEEPSEPDKDFANKVESFPIGTATAQDVVAVFGQPRETKVNSDRNNSTYMVYPKGFGVYLEQGIVNELRFNEAGAYRYQGRLEVGSSLDEALSVLGQLVQTVVGQPNGWVDNVLYKDIDGLRGYCYYACPAKGVRLFFMEYKVKELNLPARASNAQPTAVAPPANPAAPRAKNRLVRVLPFDDVRDKDLSGISFVGDTYVMFTLQFNQNTAWPSTEQLGGWQPNVLLQSAKNPGLGIKALHARGLTGKGVNVAIIDQPLYPDHPEYAGKLAEYYDTGCGSESSMHGPAVMSLLVGTNCGVAPGAKVYYAAAPSWKKDARYYADALNWIMEKNASLPADQKILCVSVSAAPSGPGSPFEQNGQLWDNAVARAESSGLVVIDCTQHHGFVSMCYYDPVAPEEVIRCRPGSRQNGGTGISGHVCAPTSPRTTAEEYQKGQYGYAYWGQGGLSWAIPYVAGVMAVGKQVAPGLPPQRLKELLYESAYVLPDDPSARIINPIAFIEATDRG